MTTAREPEAASRETIDAFLGGRLSLRQPRDGLRAGLDGVLLAAATPLRPGLAESVIDLGCGTGIVALAIASRSALARVEGLDKAPRLVELARANARDNGLDGRATFHVAEIGGPAAALAGLGLTAESFDHVVANPPFERTGERRASRAPLREQASAMAENGLECWVRAAARLARPGGSLTIIHRADALASLLEALAGRFGGLRLLPLHPRQGEPAIRILVQGRKGSRAPLVLLPGLVLHGEGNTFRPEVAAILRGEQPTLELGG